MLFLFLTMASIGLPGTSGFVAEFLALMGTYQRSTWFALLCTTSIILGAAYMLYLYRRIAYGEIKSDEVRGMSDLSGREMWLMAPIAAVVLWMGVYPESFLAPMRSDVAILMQRVDRAAPPSDSRPTPGNPAAVAALKSHEAHEEAAPGEAH